MLKKRILVAVLAVALFVGMGGPVGVLMSATAPIVNTLTDSPTVLSDYSPIPEAQAACFTVEFEIGGVTVTIEICA